MIPCPYRSHARCSLLVSPFLRGEDPVESSIVCRTIGPCGSFDAISSKKQFFTERPAHAPRSQGYSCCHAYSEDPARFLAIERSCQEYPLPLPQNQVPFSDRLWESDATPSRLLCFEVGLSSLARDDEDSPSTMIATNLVPLWQTELETVPIYDHGLDVFSNSSSCLVSGHDRVFQIDCETGVLLPSPTSRLGSPIREIIHEPGVDDVVYIASANSTSSLFRLNLEKDVVECLVDSSHELSGRPTPGLNCLCFHSFRGEIIGGCSTTGRGQKRRSFVFFYDPRERSNLSDLNSTADQYEFDIPKRSPMRVDCTSICCNTADDIFVVGTSIRRVGCFDRRMSTWKSGVYCEGTLGQEGIVDDIVPITNSVYPQTFAVATSGSLYLAWTEGSHFGAVLLEDDYQVIPFRVNRKGCLCSIPLPYGLPTLITDDEEEEGEDMVEVFAYGSSHWICQCLWYQVREKFLKKMSEICLIHITEDDLHNIESLSSRALESNMILALQELIPTLDHFPDRGYVGFRFLVPRSTAISLLTFTLTLSLLGENESLKMEDVIAVATKHDVDIADAFVKFVQYSPERAEFASLDCGFVFSMIPLVAISLGSVVETGEEEEGLNVTRRRTRVVERNLIGIENEECIRVAYKWTNLLDRHPTYELLEEIIIGTLVNPHPHVLYQYGFSVPNCDCIDPVGLPRLNLILELCDKLTIRDYLKDHDLLDNLGLIIDVLLQICSAMKHFHSLGIAYPDLKPSNVMVKIVGHRPENLVVKIGDFGGSQLVFSELRPSDVERDSGQTVGLLPLGGSIGRKIAPFLVRRGNPYYMPPPFTLIHDSIMVAQVDLWYFGVTSYELLTGEDCFCRKRQGRHGSRFHEVHVHNPLHPQIPSMSHERIDRKLVPLLNTCLQIETTSRPRSFLEVEEYLVAFQNGNDARLRQIAESWGAEMWEEVEVQ